jgi:pyruvate/2-oxoglutarate dehydrogenase complex dihydrolipoamide acyltransferase (E2) component
MLSIPTDRDIDPRTGDRAAFMAPKRLITAATLLGLGLNLAGCGGFVADHWPHWAGGMPADVPPRPGTPGYEEFIAHGQSNPEPKQEPTATAAAVQSAAQQAPVAPAPATPAPPAAPVRAAAPGNDASQDSGVVKGGLY